jgi:hypothetical protein
MSGEPTAFVSWKQSHGVDANIVYGEIKKIEDRDGVCTPHALVAEAKKRNSPLHNMADWRGWDKNHAAEQYWLSQARRIIRDIRIVVEGSDEPIVAFVSVRKDGDRGYTNTQTVVDREDLRNQMLKDALVALQALRRRYRHLSALAGVWAALDDIDRDDDDGEAEAV